MLHPSLLPTYDYAGRRSGFRRVTRHAHLRTVQAIHAVAASLERSALLTGQSDSQTKSKVPIRLQADEDLYRSKSVASDRRAASAQHDTDTCSC